MYDILDHCAFLQYALKVTDDSEQRESRKVNAPAAFTLTTPDEKLVVCTRPEEIRGLSP